jgi:hypothetical protein
MQRQLISSPGKIQHLTAGSHMPLSTSYFVPFMATCGARDPRQLTTEQLPLDVTGEIPAIARLPGPWLADERHKEKQLSPYPHCPSVQLSPVRNSYPSVMSRGDLYFKLSLFWLGTLLVAAAHMVCN